MTTRVHIVANVHPQYVASQFWKPAFGCFKSIVALWELYCVLSTCRPANTHAEVRQPLLAPPLVWLPPNTAPPILPPHHPCTNPSTQSLSVSQAEGAISLVDNQQSKDSATIGNEVTTTKSLLQQYAPQIQAVFFYYECHGEKLGNSLGRMNLSQFKVVMTRSKVTGRGLAADKLDDVFSTVATSKTALDRKNDVSGASTFTLLDFMLALVHVAYHKCLAEKKGVRFGWGTEYELFMMTS